MDEGLEPLWKMLHMQIEAYLESYDLVVEPAVLAAFARTDDPELVAATSDAFLASALRSQPSLAQALDATGIDVARLAESLPPAPYELPALLCDYVQGLEATLDVCLTSMVEGVGPPSTRRFRWNETARGVRQHQMLRLDDLILGALKNRVLDDGDGVMSAASTNHITEAVLAAAGHADQSPWNPTASQILDSLPLLFESQRSVDETVGEEQLLLHAGPGGRIRVVRQSFLSPAHFLDAGSSTFAVTGTSATDTALAELEMLIDAESPEASFQDFFERNPRFLLALRSDWVDARPHVVLHRDEDEGDLIPDFLMERIDGLVDVVELKRPDARLVVRKRNRDRLGVVFGEVVPEC